VRVHARAPVCVGGGRGGTFMSVFHCFGVSVSVRQSNFQQRRIFFFKRKLVEIICTAKRNHFCTCRCWRECFFFCTVKRQCAAGSGDVLGTNFSARY
jgi:hypothetical protein